MSYNVLTYHPLPKKLEKGRASQVPLTCFLVTFFILLRFLAGGRAAGDQETNLAVVLLGLGILTGLIMVNRPIALVLIIFDMVDMAGWINPTAWGVPGVFKFKDAEFVLLMVLGIIGLILISHVRLHHKTALFRAVTMFAIVVAMYIIYTLTFQGLSITFRVARHLIYYALFFVIPFYLRSEKELDVALKGFFVLMLASSLTHIVQTVFFPIQTLLPYMQSMEVPSGLVRLWGPSQPFNFIGLLVLFGVLLQRKQLAVFLIIALAICLLASILTLARVYTAYISIGMFVTLLLLSHKKVRLRRTVQFVSILLISFATVWMLLSMFGKQDLVVEAVSGRMEDAQTQFLTREGTLFSRIELTSVAPFLIEYAGGSVVWGIGYQGLPYSNQLIGRPIEDGFVPAFDSDNGWAGIFVSMGFVGLLFFVFFLITGAKYTFRISQHAEFGLARILSAALFAFFILAWFLWFFSALGIWQDSAIVVTIALGFMEQAVSFKPRIARQ